MSAVTQEKAPPKLFSGALAHRGGRRIVVWLLMLFAPPVMAQQYQLDASREEKCAALSAWLDTIEARAGQEVLAGRVSDNQAIIDAAAPAFRSPVFPKFFGKEFIEYSTREWQRMGADFSRCRDHRFGFVGIPFTVPNRLQLSGPWYEAILGPDYIAQINEAEATRVRERRKAGEELARQQAIRKQAAAAAQTAEPSTTCGRDDVDCVVKHACRAHGRAAEDERDAYLTCLDQNLRRELKVRQKTLAARFDVEGEVVRLYLGRHQWTEGEPGNWCGKELWGRIEYPQGFRLIPALAKTTIGILNDTLGARCPEAERVQIYVTRFSTKFSNRDALVRDTFRSSNYMTAFRDSDTWQFTLDEDHVRDLQAQARLRAFWAMVSNPTALGYVHGTIIANEAAATSAKARYSRYAREGKVCTLPEAARACHVSTTWTTTYSRIGGIGLTQHTPIRHSSCPAPCEFAEGYCNMETGRVYGDIENAERSNCRDASEEEIQAAIARVQPSTQIITYPAEILYTPWHELPHDWRRGLKF